MRLFQLGVVCFDILGCTSQIKEILVKLEENLKVKDAERKAYKEKHGIMTQEERDAMNRARARNA